MVHKRIDNEPEKAKSEKKFASDSQMKPLARDYAKTNPKSLGQEFPVQSARLTKNGWFLVECESFVMLIPGGSDSAMNLFKNIFPALHDKEAKPLLLVLDSKDKFGAYLAVGEEGTTRYFWDVEDYILSVGTQKEKTAKVKELKIEDFFTATNAP